MFGEFWVYLFVVLLTVGLATRNATLVSISGIGLVLATGTWLWSRLAVERISYRRTVSRRRIFQGEEVDVEMVINNRKSLPLARVRLADTYPIQVELLGQGMSSSPVPNTLRFSRSTTLGAYERVRWHYRLRGKQRGFYRLGPAELHTGDLFNFFPRVVHAPEEEFLLVFPKPMPLPPMNLVPQRPLGDARGSPWFPQADHARQSGLRDYQPGDPPKYIDWKASARRAALQVKQFEPGSSPLIALFVNADTVGLNYGGVIPINLERVVAVAASVADQMLADGLPLALYTNSRSVLYDHPMRVPPGRHPQQHALMMETLAMVGPYLATSMEDLLLDQSRRLPAGTTFVLITGILTEGVRETLQMLIASSGARRKPVMLWVADWEPEDVPGGVSVINLRDHLAGLEKRQEASYMEGLASRYMATGEFEPAKEKPLPEQEHLEARDVGMA
ncbi:MAG: DUF58 domain-containing protein [Dehalococcoidia bacterium]|nr:DUF58 domain-containing protein [Dehalococcoidia bacterium]